MTITNPRRHENEAFIPLDLSLPIENRLRRGNGLVTSFLLKNRLVDLLKRGRQDHDSAQGTQRHLPMRSHGDRSFGLPLSTPKTPFHDLAARRIHLAEETEEIVSAGMTSLAP
mmetsp:Transcript_13094/g.27532  ORF Transcript_13094/g.27532 Transcript_13094/m.27532 type:complete len:113 (+) Transcript_13094:1399-1737(+)